MAGLFFVLLLSYSPLAAQTGSADKIIAVIGRNKVVLQSELEQQANQMKQQDPTFNDSMKGMLLQQMLLQKMLVEQAERDSVTVSEEEVDGAFDNRMRYFIRLYGSKEKLEQASGKTIYQLREENRDAVKEQMLAEKMQTQLLQGVKITPAEVKTFFNKIPTDSLPLFPATLEVGAIVMAPPVSPEMEQYAKQKIEDLRKQIVEEGKNFETMAGLYSDDPGSRDNGGDLGTVSRTDMVPEFSTAGFRLQNGEISQVVKTKFGYHIIQMVARQGDQAHLRHILVHPETTSGDIKKAMVKLDSVRSELVSGKITFPEAVGKYTTDDNSKRTAGMMADPTTGSTQMDVSKLDPELALLIDNLKPGSFSEPQIFTTETGEKSCRIVYLRSRTEPHKANLTDDYNRIQEIALQQKKAQKLDQWLVEKLPSYYIKIAPEYQSSSVLQKWVANSAK